MHVLRGYCFDNEKWSSSAVHCNFLSQDKDVTREDPRRAHSLLHHADPVLNIDRDIFSALFYTLPTSYPNSPSTGCSCRRIFLVTLPHFTEVRDTINISTTDNRDNRQRRRGTLLFSSSSNKNLIFAPVSSLINEKKHRHSTCQVN